MVEAWQSGKKVLIFLKKDRDIPELDNIPGVYSVSIDGDTEAAVIRNKEQYAAITRTIPDNPRDLKNFINQVK